jgi:serine protease Do
LEDVYLNNYSPKLKFAFYAALGFVVISFWLGVCFANYIGSTKGVSTTTDISPYPSNVQSTGSLNLKRNSENRIADIASSCAASVVNVEAIPSSFSTPFAYSRSFRALSSGSGLIIRSNGYVVTNSHLVHPNTIIKVTLQNQEAFKAQLIGRDIFTDLAILKIDAKDLPVIPFAKKENIKAGDWAIAIGNPLGFDHTVTLGIISAINRSLSDLGSHAELLQTDAAINPGNSGGPLLNINGEVLGLNTAIRHDAQNIGFAIPADIVEQVANSLIKDGSIVRPYLGVFMKDFDNRILSNPNLPENQKGVLILRVVPDSPAYKAGLLAGDFIVSFAEQKVQSAQEIRSIVKRYKPGDQIEITYTPAVVNKGTENKRGEIKTATLCLGSYPAEEFHSY